MSEKILGTSLRLGAVEISNFLLYVSPCPGGAENFEKISVHKPMSLVYILGGRKNFLESNGKAKFFAKKYVLSQF